MDRSIETNELRHRRLMRRALVASAVLFGLLIATLLLQGCGGGERASSEPSAGPASHAVVAEAPAVPVAAVPAASPAASSTGSAMESAGETLPPEIALRDPSTTVVPGQAITITVDGTPDVTQMMLSDGVGDPQALVRDASGDGSWQVGYRVPLQPRTERIGLAVTARNEQGRWRRVWMFLQVVKPEPRIEASVSDTLGQR